MFNGQAIFLKYWFLFNEELGNNFSYKMTPLPGIKEGISGSILSGVNIGIDKTLNGDKIKAAGKVIEYFTSEEIQKSLFKNHQIISGISKFYEDDEICKTIDCKLFKSLQPISRSADISYNIYDYHEKFKKYIYNYLYENGNIKDNLKSIENLTKIHYISLNLNESLTGISFIIAIIVISLCMCLSLVFLYVKKFDFDFLPTEYWYISIMGLVFILMLIVVKLGKVTNLKCHLYILFMTIGYTFNIIPILYKLIINFPEKNKKSIWVLEHKLLFFSIFVLIDIVLNAILMAIPYDIVTIEITDGENFEKCNMNKILGSFITFLLILYKIITILIVLVLVFTEWCINETKSEMRYIVSTLYIDIICIIIILFMHFITTESYITYLLIRLGIIFILAISNYIFLFGVRLIQPFIKTKENILHGHTFKKSINKLGQSSNGATLDNESRATTNKSKSKSTVIGKLINLHYKQASFESNAILEDSQFSKVGDTSDPSKASVQYTSPDNGSLHSYK